MAVDAVLENWSPATSLPNKRGAPGDWQGAGKEYEVKVLYTEGVAHRTGPEPALSTARSAAKRRQRRHRQAIEPRIPGADDVPWAYCKNWESDAVPSLLRRYSGLDATMDGSVPLEFVYT